MLRDLLVHVSATQAARRRVQFAVELAERFGARLSGIHVIAPADLAPVFKPSRVEQAVADLSSKLTSDALAAAAMFNEETKGRLTDARWFEARGDVIGNISFYARYADLAILGQNEWQEPPTSHPLPIAHSVVLQCGRPVLVMPAVVKHTHFKRIVIAWDGSREAVRAVHDALPFLCAATSVQVISIIPESSEASAVDAESLVAHLARHAVEIQAGVQQIKTDQEHDSLRQLIKHGHYDLLVMGGYSHSMWREFIFGGATQSILMSSTIPVLVSH